MPTEAKPGTCELCKHWDAFGGDSIRWCDKIPEVLRVFGQAHRALPIGTPRGWGCIDFKKAED